MMTDQTAGPSPITDAERIRWQRDAAAVLGKLLELAAKRGLPPLTWTVGTGASLAGHSYRRPAEARRADLAAWREALGAPDTEREHTGSGGMVRLTAVWDRAGSAGRNLRPVLSDKEGYQMASVALVAEILPDLEDDEAGSEAAQ